MTSTQSGWTMTNARFAGSSTRRMLPTRRHWLFLPDMDRSCSACRCIGPEITLPYGSDGISGETMYAAYWQWGSLLTPPPTYDPITGRHSSDRGCRKDGEYQRLLKWGHQEGSTSGREELKGDPSQSCLSGLETAASTGRCN